MTVIQISGLRDDLEIIKLSSAEVLRDNEIPTKIEISEYRTDSIDTEPILPILQVTFGGVVAVVQIIKLVLELQEKRDKNTRQKDTPISINIEASNGKQLRCEISGNLTEQEVDRYLDTAQEFVNDFLSSNDGISLRGSEGENVLPQIELDIINILFQELQSRLKDIREMKSLPPIDLGDSIIFESKFENVSLKDFIRFSSQRKIYLNDNDAKKCQNIFYILEREKFLAFHEISGDFKVPEMNSLFVRYEIEKLPLFKKLIHDEGFIFSERKTGSSVRSGKVNHETIETPSNLLIGSNNSKISILLLSSDPSNVSRLRLGEEFREIQEKLQLARLRDRFSLNQRTSVRPVDISQALLDLNPHIVHFSGHGLGNGELCFENNTGKVHPVSTDALADLFEQFSGQVKCVLLNACHSKTQAAAIVKHIDYVIRMSQAIGDKAAIAFAIGFYQALGAGRTIMQAHKLGCVQIRLQGIPEHLTPVIFERSEIF